jgi:hypothetical protein
MNESKRDELLSRAFCDARPDIGGHTLRPLSLASFDVLMRTGNPLIGCETPNDGTPEFTAAIMGWTYAHCAPWDEVVKASFDPQEFQLRALVFCGSFTPDHYRAVFRAIEQQGDELSAAQVTAVSSGSKKKRRATSLGFWLGRFTRLLARLVGASAKS